VKELLKLVHTC